LRLIERNNLRADELIEHCAADQQQRMSDKPKLVRGARLDFFARPIITAGSLKFFFDLRLLLNFLCGFYVRHQY
jgi:hypothetical protein